MFCVAVPLNSLSLSLLSIYRIWATLDYVKASKNLYILLALSVVLSLIIWWFNCYNVTKKTDVTTGRTAGRLKFTQHLEGSHTIHCLGFVLTVNLQNHRKYLVSTTESNAYSLSLWLGLPVLIFSNRSHSFSYRFLIVVCPVSKFFLKRRTVHGWLGRNLSVTLSHVMWCARCRLLCQLVHIFP